MPLYATTADVNARLAGRTINATSAPSSSQVSAWIDEAESRLHRELVAAGLSTPVIGAEPINVVKDPVTSRAAVRWLESTTAGTDMEAKELLDRLTKEWEDFLTLIRTDPTRVAALIGQASTSSGGRSQLRSYPTDNKDGKSIADGDFDPVFTRDGKW